LQVPGAVKIKPLATVNTRFGCPSGLHAVAAAGEADMSDIKEALSGDDDGSGGSIGERFETARRGYEMLHLIDEARRLQWF
jgi:hypothetical protein